MPKRGLLSETVRTVSSARLNVAVNQNVADFYYFTRQDIDLIYGGLFDEGNTQV